MSNGYIGLTPDSSGKKLRTVIVTEEGHEKHDEVIRVANDSGTKINPSTSDNQSTIITQLQTINSLTPAVYDYISLSYTGDNLTGVVFKTGGSSGTTISTLTLAYSGSNLISVTKT